MSPRIRGVVIWAPRLMGLAVGLFLALFALDAFDGRPLAGALPDFALHAAPAAAVIAVVAIAWRHPWIGAAVFAALAIGYATMVPHRPDWILVISGPLAITAALYAVPSVRRAVRT
jgi:hypothetical protein